MLAAQLIEAHCGSNTPAVVSIMTSRRGRQNGSGCLRSFNWKNRFVNHTTPCIFCQPVANTGFRGVEEVPFTGANAAFSSSTILRQECAPISQYLRDSTRRIGGHHGQGPASIVHASGCASLNRREDCNPIAHARICRRMPVITGQRRLDRTAIR